MNNSEIELLIDDSGNKFYVLKDRSLDKKNSNTIFFSNNIQKLDEKYYFKCKLVHREDGPAFEDNEGSRYWYKNGKIHRTGGPAIETKGGNRYWYINGLLHRVNAPAIELDNGKREWYLNGLKHREDGPAVENANGNRDYYLNGKEVSEKNYKKFLIKKEYSELIYKVKNIKIKERFKI